MEMYLPEDILNKIMLYNSHPVADLVKQEIETFFTDDDDVSDFSGFYFEQYRFNKPCNNKPCNNNPRNDKIYCRSCDYSTDYYYICPSCRD